MSALAASEELEKPDGGVQAAADLLGRLICRIGNVCFGRKRRVGEA
jgi:hypothetical protein